MFKHLAWVKTGWQYFTYHLPKKWLCSSCPYWLDPVCFHPLIEEIKTTKVVELIKDLGESERLLTEVLAAVCASEDNCVTCAEKLDCLSGKNRFLPLVCIACFKIK